MIRVCRRPRLPPAEGMNPEKWVRPRISVRCATMSATEKEFQVCVSSTCGDLQEERAKVSQAPEPVYVFTALRHQIFNYVLVEN